MGTGSKKDHLLRNAVLIILGVFLFNLIYVLEPAGPFSRLFHSAQLAGIKACLSAADYVEGWGQGVAKEWYGNRPTWLYFLFKKPPRVVYALESSRLGSDALRYVGNSLASHAASYRNYGSANPLTDWPARIVVTARGLVLPDEPLCLSFTPAWAMNLWPSGLAGAWSWLVRA